MLEGLEWIRFRDAYCVVFARGLDETELLRRLDGDLSTELLSRLDGDLSSARLARVTDENIVEELRSHVVQVGWCDGWAFAYEWNGLPPSPEKMSVISAGTAAVSVFCNVNAHTRFCYAEDGTVVANFDPIDAQDSWFFEQASPQVLALLERAGITPSLGEDEDDYDEVFDFVGAMHALAEAAGAHLDRESIAEKPLLCSGIRPERRL
jgi:hypothetical protein